MPGTGSQFGLGDTTQSLFLSPKEPRTRRADLGRRPGVSLADCDRRRARHRKWGARPDRRGAAAAGPWTYGMLANHIWSFAGDDDRADVSCDLPAAVLRLHDAKRRSRYTLNTESTYDWETERLVGPDQRHRHQTAKIGKQPVQLGVGAALLGADAGERAGGMGRAGGGRASCSRSARAWRRGGSRASRSRAAAAHRHPRQPAGAGAGARGARPADGGARPAGGGLRDRGDPHHRRPGAGPAAARAGRQGALHPRDRGGAGRGPRSTSRCTR